MTRSHISPFEAGRRVPREEDARRLDLVLGTVNALTSFRPGAEDDGVLAHYFGAARHLEQQATMIREFALSPRTRPGPRTRAGRDANHRV
ncbi:hypothetical protein ACFWHJ_06595, partial [Streptomyces cyaneofuscatus]